MENKESAISLIVEYVYDLAKKMEIIRLTKNDENNEVTMLSSFGEEKKLSYSRKSIIAEKILNLIHLSCQEKAH